MTYDKEFEDFISGIPMNCHMKDNMHLAWQAARKDHYRIGEDVESILTGERAEVKAVLSFSGSITHINPNNIRRIPAWTPKEGEAVLFENTQGLAEAGNAEKVSRFVTVRCSNGIAFTGELCQLKPFSADKIGKPWEEI
jgi:hypothetical protein